MSKPWKDYSNEKTTKVFGVQISEDFGKTWRVRALCQNCISKIEPPKMAKKEIEAGTFTCDWCGVINEMYAETRKGAK